MVCAQNVLITLYGTYWLPKHKHSAYSILAWAREQPHSFKEQWA